MNISKHIPNTITCLNLLSGALACVMVMRYDNTLAAFYLILLAAVFDFSDGFAARSLHAYSKIGAELDSLADVVSFGLAPGCMIFVCLDQITNGNFVRFVGLLLPVFAALRLAKFNTDTRQTTSFLGLPVPSTALFWAALIPVIEPFGMQHPAVCSIVVVALVGAFCGLMVSEIPMFSLKFKNFTWKDNHKPFILIALSVAWIVLFAVVGVPMISVSVIICSYILLSLIFKS
ncbi:MAG: CDP-alcohol phosphatidyltransferase family protein [Candidatus Symbiothrix sp.]|jgi:CDP-diacylglycerol--serine O-phosphatidyltransferase|nr:CDP-alcohol phosphatidyltransferase family protein [Candidatus Symbiothrix sp.]